MLVYKKPRGSNAIHREPVKYGCIGQLLCRVLVEHINSCWLSAFRLSYPAAGDWNDENCWEDMKHA